MKKYFVSLLLLFSLLGCRAPQAIFTDGKMIVDPGMIVTFTRKDAAGMEQTFAGNTMGHDWWAQTKTIFVHMFDGVVGIASKTTATVGK